LEGVSEGAGGNDRRVDRARVIRRDRPAVTTLVKVAMQLFPPSQTCVRPHAAVSLKVIEEQHTLGSICSNSPVLGETLFGHVIGPGVGCCFLFYSEVLPCCHF
jgi:hypothetical protein